MPVILKTDAKAPEKALDAGEVIVPPAAVNTMTEIATLNEPVANPETAYDGTTLVIGAIVVYFLIKIAMRLLPWILGVSALIVFLKMYGG